VIVFVIRAALLVLLLNTTAWGGVSVTYEIGCPGARMDKEKDMFNVKQFKDWIVFPVLFEMQLYSDVAERLVLGTIAQESKLGTYLHQIRGPALGIGQMEKPTHDDIVNRFLIYKKTLQDRILAAACVTEFDSSYLVFNLRYAVAFVRIQYYRVPAALPENNVDSLARYWKKYYNTPKGRGTVAEFKKNYLRFVERGN